MYLVLLLLFSYYIFGVLGRGRAITIIIHYTKVVRRRKILQSPQLCTVCHTTLTVRSYSTASFLFLGPTALIYNYIKKNGARCNEDQRGVGIFKIERVIR